MFSTIGQHPEAATAPSRGANPPRRPFAEEVIYQAVTVGAILLILGTLWIF